jgi:hypothetical protein
MPVQKFRSFEEARRALWLSSGDPQLLLRMKRLDGMARSRRRIQPGVTRFRTIAAAKGDKGKVRQT